MPAMVATKMVWFSSISNRVGNGLLRRPTQTTALKAKKKTSQVIGILAFETAKTMLRLVSLYRSLSDIEILRLRQDVMQSEGVRFLNSADDGFLLRLACAEKIHDLDRVAFAVARLGKRCSDPALQGFESVYADMKLGLVDFAAFAFSGKEIVARMVKMEKLVSATADLYSSLETLTELEASERRFESWKSCSGPAQDQKSSPELLDQKLAAQRDHVRRARESSLWGRSFDKMVELMARAVCNVFTRICAVFGPHVSGLPRLDGNVFIKPEFLQTAPRLPPTVYMSGPLERLPPAKKPDSDPVSRNSGPISCSPRKETKALAFFLGLGHAISFNDVGLPKLEPAATTLGAAALALRYSNVIALAEKLLNSSHPVDSETRGEMYQMLPPAVRAMVREKMRRAGRQRDELDESLAEGWKEGVGRILGWLAPMAHDTIRWQQEQNMEHQDFEARPAVMRLQTLFYADREKAEAAIVEVLVGLSCIFRHNNREA